MVHGDVCPWLPGCAVSLAVQMREGGSPAGPTHPGSPPLRSSQTLGGGGRVWGLEGRVQEVPEAWLQSHLPSLPERLTLGVGAPRLHLPGSALPPVSPSALLAFLPEPEPVVSDATWLRPQSSVVTPGQGPCPGWTLLTSLPASPQALHGRCGLSGHPHAGHGPALLPWPDNQAPQVGPGQTLGWLSP